MSRTALDNWQAPLPADSPDWEECLESHIAELKRVRDAMAYDYQRIGKDALSGHAADILGEQVDTLCDVITEMSDGVERLAQETGGGGI